MSRSEQRRQAREGESESNKILYVLGAVAVIGIGAFLYTAGSSAFSSAATAPVELTIASDEELIELAQGVSLGDPDAPVTIVEFGDYQCPGCGSFAMQVKPQIDATLVQSGRAEFVFYDFPLVQIHPNAFLAARAARCAGDQGKYWEFHQEVFRNQSRWSSATMPTSAFEDYAETVGVDGGEFSSCVNSDRHADVVSANMELGARMGVSGTPTIMINADGQVRRLNAVDFPSIVGAIDAMTATPGGN
ncbi:MAG: DsbA family protein [Gemmatimonadota bacterium]|nr:DsbA family protein [Gemmatimonadota bacterium]MDH3424749.1 DsbA family protein [Gemmatimonadota bacterium]